MKQKLLLLPLLLSFISFSAFSQTVGQTDDFQSGLQNWFEPGASPNPPVLIANGGPAGAGDAYMSNYSSGTSGPGGRAVTRNVVQWTGDFITAGIDAIRFDAKAIGADLNFRIAMNGSGGRIASSTAVTVTAGSNWTSVTIPIGVGDMTTAFPTGGFDVAGTLGDAFEMRILSNPSADYIGEIIDATMEIDNVQAVSTLSTAEQSLNSDFRILPNPGKNTLNIYLPDAESSSSQVEVFDVLGKRVLSGNLTGLESRFNISSWNNGVYLVKVWNGQSTQTKRFVKL